MREWLVIEDSRKNGVFMDRALLKPTGFIPRDVAERILGRRMEGNQWFTAEESALMRAQPEWTTVLDDCGGACVDPIGCFQNKRCIEKHDYDPMRTIDSGKASP